MRVKKDSHEYVCVFLKPGYFETGVLGDYFRRDGARCREACILLDRQH